MTGPQDPFTQLQQACHQFHELFRAYLEAGFSPEQSFALVVVVLQETMRKL
jgi:hypothetical protein